MFQAYGLTTHIRANRARSAVLLIALFAMSFVMAYGLLLIADGVMLRYGYDLFRDGAAAKPALAPFNAGFVRHVAAARYSAPSFHAHTFQELLILAGGQLLKASPLVVALTLLWALGGTWASQSLVAMASGAREASTAESRKLLALLENLCISRGMATPRLEIVDDSALNAFASGFGKGNYCVTVTTGLLETLDSDEIEAVLGHELTHIRNEDVRLMTFAGVIVGAFAFIADILQDLMFRVRWRLAGRGSGDKNGGLAFLAIAVGFALVIFAWFSSVLIRLCLSRKREFLADAGSVELTKNPDAMISALQKISGHSALLRAPSGLMEMCIDNPGDRWIDLFATHPSIDRRIDALKRYAAGRERDPSRPGKPSFAEAARRSAGAGPKPLFNPTAPKPYRALPSEQTPAPAAPEPAPVSALAATAALMGRKNAAEQPSVLQGLSSDRLALLRVAPRAKAG